MGKTPKCSCSVIVQLQACWRRASNNRDYGPYVGEMSQGSKIDSMAIWSHAGPCRSLGFLLKETTLGDHRTAFDLLVFENYENMFDTLIPLFLAGSFFTFTNLTTLALASDLTFSSYKPKTAANLLIKARIHMAQTHESRPNGAFSEVLLRRNCSGSAESSFACSLHAFRAPNVAEWKAVPGEKHGVLASKTQSMLVGLM